jgi:hypothetical protein
MQILLTQEEYDALKSAPERVKENQRALLQRLCTEIADLKPVLGWWNRTEGTPTPWGCIHTRKSEWYCDDCPVKHDCPETHKNWSQ